MAASLLPAVPVRAAQEGALTSAVERASEEAEDEAVETDRKAENGGNAENSENAADGEQSADDKEEVAKTQQDEDVESEVNEDSTDSYIEGTLDPEVIDSDADRTEEDCDQAYEEYLSSLFQTGDGASVYSFGDGTYSRRNSLPERERAVYDEIAKALPDLAGGAREDANFQIPISALVDGYTDGQMFTWEELGVTLSGGAVTAADTQKGAEALKAKVSVDYELVRDALMADFPYETYWTDGGIAYGSFSYSYNQTGMKFSKDSIPVSLRVEYKFRGKDPYTIDVTKTGVGQKAADKARSIVEAAGDQSDYGKLKYYLNEICDLVDYNDAAASSGSPSETDDRGPWNLLYVFDGDPDTKVVCEGYAEAFQYLCELTTFSSAEIEIASVTGQMNGGGHKWNLAHMEDGKNYLIDVTNCDEGAAGYPDRLFLADCADYTDASHAFTVNGISYGYDADTRELFSEEELKLSDTDYSGKEKDAISLCANRLSLTGSIGVQYYIEMPEEVQQNPDTFVCFEVDGREQKKAASSGEKMTLTYPSTGQNVTVYEYTCEVAASQMTSDIHASVVQADAETTQLRTYSVKQYADNRLSQSGISDEEKALLQALENYGAYAQAYFNRNTDKPANAGLSDTDVSSIAAGDIQSYVKTTAGSMPGLSYYGSSLVLRSQTLLRHYFRLEDGHDIGEYTFRNETSGVLLQPVKTGSKNLFYVEISDRKANELNTAYTVSVQQNAEGTSDWKLSYSAMSYAYDTLKGEGEPESLQNLMRALVIYSDKAERYFDRSSTISHATTGENKLSGVPGDFYDMKLASAGTVARWESSLPQYVSVSEEGRVRFLKEGASWIKAYDADGNVLQTCLACVVGEDIPEGVDFFVIPQLYGEAGGGQNGEPEVGDSSNVLRDTVEKMKSSGISVLFLPQGNYRIYPTVSLPLLGGMTLIMQDGAKLHGIGSAEKNYNLICIRNVSNVKVIGGWIEGDLQRRQTSSTDGEGGMGIGIYGSDNVEIRNVKVSHCWGDGIYVGETPDKVPSTNVVISNCVSSENLRNNMSIVSANQVRVEASSFTDTPSNGKAPMMGIDIEPNDAGTCRKITISNCTFRNNRQAGIGIITQNAAALADEITIDHCNLEDSFWNYSGTNVTLKGTSVGGEANLRRVVSVEDGTVFNEGTEAEDVLVAELNPAAAGAGSSYNSDGSMSASVAEDADALYGKVLRLKRTTTGSKEGGGRSYSLGQLKTTDGQNFLKAGKKYRFVYSVKGSGEWGIQTSQTGWYGCLPESTAFKVGAVSYTAGSYTTESGSSCNLMITGESLTSGMWLDLEWLRIYEVK